MNKEDPQTPDEHGQLGNEVKEDEVSEVVDPVARKELRKLRERFEGGTLVPRYSLIARKALYSITSWSGWEILGIGCGFSVLLLGLIAGNVFLGQSCSTHHQEIVERQADHIRKQFQPICDTFNLQFVSVQNVQVINNSGDNACSGELCPGIVETVVCAGNDRVITVNARNISETEVQLIEE